MNAFLENLSRRRLAAYTALGMAIITAGMYSNAAHQVIGMEAAQQEDSCISDQAAPVLEKMGLTGVAVVVQDGIDSDPSALGVVSSWQPNVIVVDAQVAGWCSPGGKNSALEVTIAHEGAHIAQYRLARMTDGPAVGTVVSGPARVRLAVLSHKLGAPFGGPSGLEHSADCAVIAYGFPDPADVGQGYGGSCTSADLNEARAVVEGR